MGLRTRTVTANEPARPLHPAGSHGGSAMDVRHAIASLAALPDDLGRLAAAGSPCGRPLVDITAARHSDINKQKFDN